MDICVIDVETSSLDPKTQEVLELSVMRIPHLGSPRHKTWQFRPQLAIDPRTTAVHGLTAEKLAGAPLFRDSVADIASYIYETQVIMGYNVDFDLRALDAQIARSGFNPWNRDKVIVMDLYRLWQVRERRQLQDAFKRFVNPAGYDGAHGAHADVEATWKVWLGMYETFDLQQVFGAGIDTGPGWSALAQECNPKKPEHIGSKHLAWKDGRVVVNFGKHAGVALANVPYGYVRWMLDSAQLPRETWAVVREWMNGGGPGVSVDKWEAVFTKWVADKYPPPSAAE